MASFLGPQRFEVIVDREKFERELVCLLEGGRVRDSIQRLAKLWVCLRPDLVLATLRYHVLHTVAM